MTNRIQVKYDSVWKTWEARIWHNHAYRPVPGYYQTKREMVEAAKEFLDFLLAKNDRDGEWHDVII